MTFEVEEKEVANVDRQSIEMTNNNTILKYSDTSLTAITSSIQWYMKNILNIQYNWYYETIIPYLPYELPPISKNKIIKIQRTPFTYYENVYTVSYLMWSWNWTIWENHIDWMALNRINLPLLFTGQEIVCKEKFQM